MVDGRRSYRFTGKVNVAGLLPDAVISRLQAGVSDSPFMVAPTGTNEGTVGALPLDVLALAGR